MKRRRAEDAPQRAELVPYDIVYLIWAYMPQFWLIRARAVSRDWKAWIDAALQPALDAAISKLRADRASRDRFRIERAREGFGPLKPWSEAKYRYAAAFELGYTHMLASRFATPSSGREAFRHLIYSAKVPWTAMVRLLSDSKYEWKRKDYVWSLAAACRRGEFDAARRICGMMHRRRIGADVRAAHNAIEAGCDEETTRALLNFCSAAAAEALAARLSELAARAEPVSY